MRNKALEKLTHELQALMENVDNSVNGTKKSLEEMQLEMIKQQSTILIRHIMKRCLESESLCEDILQTHKSWERCMKYVTEHAKVYAIRGSSGMVACIPDSQVYEWAEDYFRLDDKEEAEKEMAEAAKKAEEAAKRAEEDAKKEARAREKAVEKLSSEEGWGELSKEEQEKRIKDETRKIKYSLGKSKISKKASKKTAKKEEIKEATKTEKEASTKTSSFEAAYNSYVAETPNASAITFVEVDYDDPKEKNKTDEVKIDGNGEQMDFFSMLSV